jgi:hypothetical protein
MYVREGAGIVTTLQAVQPSNGGPVSRRGEECFFSKKSTMAQGPSQPFI